MADPAAPHRHQVDDLLDRLTLAEKLGLLHQYQAPVPRLGLPAFTTGTEALHGLAGHGPATVFPQAVGLATSWNPPLLRAVGAVVAAEVRAAGADRNVWAPVVNPLRDPRWGRNEEGYAEDPWLTGTLATAYATGLRGAAGDTAPTLKHFLGYNHETDRHITSSNLTPRVLHEYELPAFRIPVEAGAVAGVMASYNLVNGRPAHLSPLINEELRRWSDDELVVFGDAGAVSNIAGDQGYLPDHVSGFAAALLAGVDSFTEHDADSGPTVARLTAALERGLLEESDVDRAVRRILRLRLSLSPDPPAVPAAAGPLAREAARQSLVLLRNDGGTLPLDPVTVRRVAVVGPLADTVFTDWYSGTLPYAVTARAGIAARAETTFHDGADRIVLRHGGRVAFRLDVFDWGHGVVALRCVDSGRFLGTDDNDALVADRDAPGGWVVRETFRFVELPGGAVALHHCATDRFVTVTGDRAAADARTLAEATAFDVELTVDGVRAAAELAARADVAVVVAGNHPMVNGRETEDRADLALPGAQAELIRAVGAANPRTVLVLSSSYPYAVGPRPPAVLWSAHGGQEYGAALAAVLFGAADPGGRLTQTWYRSAAELPDLLDYDIIGNDATYLYYRGEPLFPFGHGLSYTTFAYGAPRLSQPVVGEGDELVVSLTVTNTGARPGDEVVQLYSRQHRAPVKLPLRQLRAFARVSLAPGATTTVRLRLRARDLARWDEAEDRYVVDTARHSLLIGRSSTDIVRTSDVDVHGFVGAAPDRRAVGASHE
jgi:beta-glucosidase